MRKLISSFMALSLLIAVPALQSEPASADVGDPVCDLVGSGTPLDAYKVSSKDDLLEMEDCFGEDVRFELTQSIDLSSETLTGAFGSGFEGHLDGRGYLIDGYNSSDDPKQIVSSSANFGFWETVQGDSSVKNLKINGFLMRPKVDANVGVLFGSMSSGSLLIENVSIKNTSIFPQSASGSNDRPLTDGGFIIGEVTDSSLTVINSVLLGSVQTHNSGGVAGKLSGVELVVRNLSTSAAVSYDGYAGGVAGEISDTQASRGLVDVRGVTVSGTTQALSATDQYGTDEIKGSAPTIIGGLFGSLKLASGEVSIIESVHLDVDFNKGAGAGAVRMGGIIGELTSPIIADDVMLDIYAFSAVNTTDDVICQVALDADGDDSALSDPGLILGDIFHEQPPSNYDFPAEKVASNCLGSDSVTNIVSSETSFIPPSAVTYAAGAKAIEACDASNWGDWDPNATDAPAGCTFAPGIDAKGISEFGQGLRITEDIAELSAVDSSFSWFKPEFGLPYPLWHLGAGLGAPNQGANPLNSKVFEVFFEQTAADTGTPMDPVLVKGDYTLPTAQELSFGKDGSVLRKWKDTSNGTFKDPGAVVSISADKRYEAIWSDLCSSGTYSADGFADENGNCTPASLGHYVTNAGATSQLECEAGTYQNQTGQSVCIDAEPGFFVDTVGAASQERCGLGEFSEFAASDSCQKAAPGFAAEVAGFDATVDDYATFFTNDATPGARSETPCLAGTYSPGGVEQCLETPVGEFTSASQVDRPSLCPAGTYQDETGQTGCKNAQPGFYVALPGSEFPTECSTGTYTTQTTQRSCVLAPAGHYLSKASFTAGSQDEIDFVGVGTGADIARECPAGTFAAFGDGVCTDAPVGHYVSSVGASAPTACDPGTFQDQTGQTTCKQADAGHYVSAVAATEQLECEAGSFTSNSGATYCLEAEPGYKVAAAGADAQVACSPGTYSTGGATECTDAAAGFYVAGSAQFYQIACAAGTYTDQSAQTECKDVEAGYVSSGTTERAQCPAGSYASTTGVECITASPGYFVDLPGAGNQVACEAGTYSTNAGASECINASPGFFVPKSGMSDQVECAVGFYQSGSKSSSCVIAPAGYKAHNTTTPAKTTGSDSIVACPAGSYSPGGVSECIETPAGHFNPAPDFGLPGTATDDVLNTEAIECGLGRYQDQSGASSCKTADPGHFVATTTATSQTQCQGDSYASSNGASECLLPPPGKTASADKTAAVNCDAGTFSVGRGAGCEDALPGYYVATAGSSSQVACGPGTYQPNARSTECLLAPAGHAIGEIAASSLESRFECEAGSFSANPGSSTCREAMPGHYVATSGATQQTQCAPGTFSASFGASSCDLAPAGKYVITGLQFAAIDCPLNTNSNDGASECTPDEQFVPTTPPSAGPIGGGGGGGGAVGAAPVADVRPVVAGSNSVGNNLSTSEGEWQGDSLEFSYQWYRCDDQLESPTQLQVLIDCDLIQGATNETYQVTSADDGKHLLASISASAGFYSTTAFSDTIAPGETLAGEVAAETDEPASDAATSTGYWTKRNGDNVKMYAKNIIGLGKVQFFVNGEETAWIGAADRTDPKLRVITEGHMKGASYLVRDKDLSPGKNVFEIYLDGERIVRRVASLN